MIVFNYKIFTLLSLIVFTITSNVIYSQGEYEVTGVSFEGNETIGDGTLEDAVALSSTGWFSKNILGNDPILFNSELLDADLKNITKVYQREGFLFVKVKAEEITDDENEEIDIIFNIDEGPPIMVDSVQISKSDSSVNSELNIDSLISDAYQYLTLTKGKRFRDDDIRNDETQIIKLFLDNGYPHVHINFDLNVDTIDCLVSINWYVNPGVLSAFGKTSISGLDYYPENIIKSKLDYSQGEIFNAGKLDKNQKRLSNLGIFYSVSFNSKLKTDPPSIIPIKLTLVEAKRLKTTFGIGYGKDEKFRGMLDFTLFGFLKGPGRLNFEAKSSAIEKFKFKLNYTHPEFLWQEAYFRLNTYVAEVHEIPYNENSKGINIGVFRTISNKIFLSINYGLENIKLDIGSIAIQQDSSQLLDNYNKSSIKLVVGIRNAEPYNSPETGFYISLGNTYSGLGMGSPYRFFKSIIDLRKYNTIYNSLIMAIKLSLGNIKSYNIPEFIPVEERFYLGGSSSVRGWRRLEIGNPDINGKPKGGNSFMEGSIEFRYPAFETIYGVFFIDFGNVWEQMLTYKINELQYAAGVGLRYSTPIGPLRLDLARPIFNTNKKFQFWFSIGHAF